MEIKLSETPLTPLASHTLFGLAGKILPELTNLAFYPLTILTILIIILTTYSISRFRNRMHQIKLNKITILLNVFLIAAVFLEYPKLMTNANIELDLSTGAYFPLVSLVLLVVANRYIMKDEKLVRSVDRLR